MNKDKKPVAEKKAEIADLLALLAQVNEGAHGNRAPAPFPGLDSYVPSYVSSGADSQRASQWVIGMKY